MYTIGDWPSIWPNGSIYANGGVPQAANLSQHLAKVRSDIERLFPDPDHDGIVAIDWEVWEPWLDPRSSSVYAQLSFKLAGGDKAAAVAAWNASSLEFMAETLKAAKALRPHAAWGYYGMIGCFARWDVAEGVCDAEIRARNDALAPLWSAGTALFPSIYSECSFAPGPDGVMRCQPGGPPMPDPYPGNANSTEEQRIAISLRETARVNREKLPVIPFTWYVLCEF